MNFFISGHDKIVQYIDGPDEHNEQNKTFLR